MTLGDAAEPFVHIQEFRVDEADRPIGLVPKFCIAGTFHRSQPAAW